MNYVLYVFDISIYLRFVVTRETKKVFYKERSEYIFMVLNKFIPLTLFKRNTFNTSTQVTINSNQKAICSVLCRRL